MTYTVPYSFIPGTKARAQEVNANFGALTDSLNDLNEDKANNDLSNITTAGINVIKNNSSLRNLGEIIYSQIPLTDSSLHLLDGTKINKEGIYENFVNYIAELYGDGTNPPSYFTGETSWQNSITTYGVCGKFVYDSTSNTVRLPKITGILEGTTDINALGNLVQAGLPNITGSIANAVYGIYENQYDNQGVFKNSTKDLQTGWSQVQGGGDHEGSYRRNTIRFSASDSNSIYGNSNTVQPQSIKCFIYIVLASVAKSEIQVDIDEIATDLNGKADTDLSNCVSNISSSAKNAIINLINPDMSAGVSKSISGFTADKNGWIYIYGCVYGGDTGVYKNGERIYDLATNGTTNPKVVSATMLPIFKNDIITTSIASQYVEALTITFYPMKGDI